jgi:hypothetical protein
MSRPADAYRREQSAGKKPRKQKEPKPVREPSIKGFIKETSRDTGYRKAAQFLMLLGKDEAARVLRHMSPEEVEGITLEIARTQHIEEKEASKILEEFGYIRETKDLIAQGGFEKAQEMLIASIGKERRRRSWSASARTWRLPRSRSSRTSTSTRLFPWCEASRCPSPP